jgi:hypothetical protein
MDNLSRRTKHAEREVRMRRSSFLVALVLLTSVARAEDAPDVAALVKAGAETTAKLATTGARWKTTLTLGPGGASFVIDEVLANGMRRRELSLGTGNQKQTLLTIIERDGLWYYDEGGELRTKSRPFEAPATLPAVYIPLVQGELFAVSKNLLAGATWESTKDGIASFRTKVPAEMRARLENAAGELEKRGLPDAKKVRDFLEKGFVTRVDTAKGLMVEQRTATRILTLSKFEWLDKVDEERFAVPGEWQDLTGDPGDRGELVMLGHCGAWRPGGPKVDLDGRLLDMKSGVLRRIPFQGIAVIPVCFLPGRRKVVVSGATERGSFSLFEVDLETGKNRHLGGAKLASGMTMGGAVSPDGKLLATVNLPMLGQGTKILEGHVALVDLATGEARFLGEPLDTAFPSWLPDGKGLVIVKRDSSGNMNEPPRSTICRMDLEGKLVALREGSSPIVIEGKRILFQDDQLWKTCDLEGKDEQLFAGGLKGHGFPAPAPDGKRILFMRFAQGKGPAPTIYELGSSEDGRS